MSKQSKGLYAIVLIGLALLIIGGVLVLRGERAKERTRLSHLYDTVITDITDVLRVTVLESEVVKVRADHVVPGHPDLVEGVPV